MWPRTRIKRSQILNKYIFSIKYSPQYQYVELFTNFLSNGKGCNDMRVTINKGQEVYQNIPLMTARQRYIKADVWEIKKAIIERSAINGWTVQALQQMN